MSTRSAFDKPSHVQVIEGEVVVVGPEGVGHSFTPQAARETGRRLAGAADEADNGGGSGPEPDGADPIQS